MPVDPTASSIGVTRLASLKSMPTPSTVTDARCAEPASAWLPGGGAVQFSVPSASTAPDTRPPRTASRGIAIERSALDARHLLQRGLDAVDFQFRVEPAEARAGTQSETGKADAEGDRGRAEGVLEAEVRALKRECVEVQRPDLTLLVGEAVGEVEVDFASGFGQVRWSVEQRPDSGQLQVGDA
jgi:hypothetical protein